MVRIATESQSHLNRVAFFIGFPELRAKIDKDVHFHLSRHSFVDILKQNGVSAEIRMQMVGHNSEKIHNKYHGEFDREKLSDISRKILGK